VHTTGSTTSTSTLTSRPSDNDKKHVNRSEKKARFKEEITKSRKQRKSLEEEYEEKLLKTEKKTVEKVLRHTLGQG